MDTPAFDVNVRQAVHPITEDIIRQAFAAAEAPVEFVRVDPPQPSGPGGEPAVHCYVKFQGSAAAQKAQAIAGRAIYPNACYIDLTPARGGYGGGGRGGGMMGGHHGHHHAHHAHGHHHHQHHGGHHMMHHGHQHHHHGGHGHHHHAHGQQHQHHQGGMPHQHMHQHHHHGFGGGAGRGGGMMGGGPPGMMRGGGRGGMGGRGGYMGQQQQGFFDPANQPPPILIVNGVPTTVSLQKLFTLLEVYGVVLGLRRQVKSPETVVAKFEVYKDAIEAAKFLSGCPFYGLELQLRHFPNYSDKAGFLPGPEQSSDPNDPACTTFDFTTARHRGKPHGGGVIGKKFGPSPYLFIGNLTEAITEEDLRAVFAEKGGHQIKEIDRNSVHFAVVDMKDPAAATAALIDVHSHLIKDRFLKLTFSNVSPKETPPARYPLAQAIAAAQGKPMETVVGAPEEAPHQHQQQQDPSAVSEQQQQQQPQPENAGVAPEQSL